MSLVKTTAKTGLLIGCGLIGFVGYQVIKPQLLSPAAGINVDVAENVIVLPTEDSAMHLAEIAAKETLPLFLARAKTPPPTWQSYGIKARFEGSETQEVIWIDRFEDLGDGSFTGYLANDPVDMPGYSIGSKVDFQYDDIADWSVVMGGRGYGFYTLPPLLAEMPEDEAAAVRAFLADNATPADWG